jgi:hypothetical protein
MPPRSILILAWLLMPLAPAAGAQQPATAYDVHEALGATLREIAAAQTSFHEVHARFAESLAELSYQAPPDQSIVIAASDTTRWNAVATHRLILGVRCALVQGTPPVIRGQRVNGEPACEGKVQRLRLNFEQPVGAAASLLEQIPMRLY